MQSPRSIDYFRGVFNAALIYFGRPQKPKNKSSREANGNVDEDFLEIIEEDRTRSNNSRRFLHDSYKLFYRQLPTTIVRDLTIRQDRVRQFYKRTFDEQQELLSKGIISAHRAQESFENFDEEIQQALEHDIEQNFETTDENDETLDENELNNFDNQLTINDESDPLPVKFEIFLSTKLVRFQFSVFFQRTSRRRKPKSDRRRNIENADRFEQFSLFSFRPNDFFSHPEENSKLDESQKTESEVQREDFVPTIEQKVELVDEQKSSNETENANKIHGEQQTSNQDILSDLHFDFAPENFNAEQVRISRPENRRKRFVYSFF